MGFVTVLTRLMRFGEFSGPCTVHLIPEVV